MSVSLDPPFLTKILGSYFIPFKDRVEASFTSSRPPPNSVPLSVEARRISRMNLELLEDNSIADENVSSLTAQIEEGPLVLASKCARIHNLEGQPDSSQLECASLPSQLGEKTRLAKGYNGRIGDLEELSSAEDVETTLGVKVRDDKDRLDALKRCNAILYTADKTLRTELRTHSRDFENTRRDLALEIAKWRGKLIEMRGSRERMKKALEEESVQLDSVQAELDATQEKLQVERGVELDIQLAEKDRELHNSIADFVRASHDGQARFEEASGWSDDLYACVEDKDKIIEESRDEISQLKARILELEGQLTAFVPSSIPVLDKPTFEVTTITPLDDTPSSDIVPACNLPQDADYFARIAPEATYEGSITGVDAGPDILESHSVKILLTRPQRRGVYKIRTPYSTTRLGVRNNIIVSTHDLVTRETINLGEGPQPAQAPDQSKPQLRATAPAFTPSLGQPQASVDPSQLCPSVPSFVPRPLAIQPPPFRIGVPSFIPCQPPFQVPQLHASVPGFAPWPRGQPVVNIPLNPMAFIPRQPMMALVG